MAFGSHSQRITVRWSRAQNAWVGMTPDCGTNEDTGALENKRGTILALTLMTTVPQLFLQSQAPTGVLWGQEVHKNQLIYGLCLGFCG